MELMLKSEQYSYKLLDDAEFETRSQALSPITIPLEQSLVWGAFNNNVEGREFLGSFRYDDASGKLIALASATLYHERGRDWIWIKHGPLFASVPNTEIIQKLCATLKKQYASTNALFVRLSLPEKVSSAVLPFEHTMYDETVVIELEKTEDELFAEMSQSGRQGVRKAIKAEVSVEEITENRSQIFKDTCYPILEETGKRDGFGIHPLSIYTSMLENLPSNSRLYTARSDGGVEAWAITTEFSSQVMYYYGASNAKARETHAAYALQWEIMKAMKQRGYKTYDLMGIAGKHYSGLKNVTQFKTKFSKNIVSIPLTYDLPLQSVKYRTLALAIRAKRKLKR